MMKKLTFALVVLMLALGLGSAMALSGTLGVASNEHVDTCVGIGDQVYFFGPVYDEETLAGQYKLRRWNPADNTVTVLESDMLASSDEVATMLHMDPSVEKTQYGIGYLFTDGERLMALDSSDGTVFEIVVDGDQVSVKEMVKLQDCSHALVFNEDGEWNSINVSSIFVSDNRLWMVGYDYSNSEQNFLDSWSLGDGSAKHYQIDDLQAAFAYKDGQIMARIFNWDTAIDHNTGEYLKYPVLRAYDSDMNPTGFEIQLPWGNVQSYVYDEKDDLILYVDNLKLTGVSADGTTKQVGYVPNDYIDNGLGFMNGDSIYLNEWNRIFVRGVDLNFDPGQKLVISGGYMDQGTMAFLEKHPDVSVYNSEDYYYSIDSMNQALVSGEETVDIYSMMVYYENFEYMMEKGYCLALDEIPELKAYLDRMYPYLTEAVTYDGHIYAIPYQADGEGWEWFREEAEKCGLTTEDLPKNDLELIALAQRFADEISEEYPDVWLFSEGTKSRLFDVIMSDYRLWMEKTQGELKFDTDEFRTVYQAWSELDTTEMDARVSAGISADDWHEGILSVIGNMVTQFNWSDGQDGNDYAMVPFFNRLTAETEPVIPVNTVVYVINPKSEHIDLAVEYICDQMETMENQMQYVMFSDKTEPLRNEDYDYWVARYEKDIKDLEDQLAKAETEEEKTQIQEEIDWNREYLEGDMKSIEYTISEESLEYFRENILPYLYVERYTVLRDSDAGFSTLIDRLEQGQIDVEQFIREADNKLRMVRMENE